MDANRFSVVWTGKLKGFESFAGCIGISGQDSMRLYVDGELLIDNWGENRKSAVLEDFDFELGEEHDIRLEFKNDARGARVILGYNRGRESWDVARRAVKEAEAVKAGM